MIASVDFHRFKALRSTRLAMAPCNLVLGPNGSGKTSLIESLMQLRGLAVLHGGRGPRAKGPAFAEPTAGKHGTKVGPMIDFGFTPPHDEIRIRISCASDSVCNELEVKPPGAAGWPTLREQIGRIRDFVLDHLAISGASRASGAVATELVRDGGNLGEVLAYLRDGEPAAFAALSEDFRRIMPEYSGLAIEGGARLGAVLADEGKRIDASGMSQGSLYLLALLAIAHHPRPPSVACFEEVDRGIHPRLLREVRDTLYRLSYPEAFGVKRPPCQVIATTFSPHLLDLFRDHPEEVVISHKQGSRAHFSRLSDRKDLGELLREGSLGDIWLTGILGGMPSDSMPDAGGQMPEDR